MIYSLYYILGLSKLTGIIAFAAFFLLAGYNFCSWVNIDTTLLWYYNAGDLAILRKINNETKNKQGKLKLGISWYSESAFRYDIEHYYPGRFQPLVIISFIPTVDSGFDYFFVDLDDLPKVPGCYERDTSCIGGGFILLKRKDGSTAAAK